MGNQETPLNMQKEVTGTRKKLPKDVMATSEKAPSHWGSTFPTRTQQI